MLVAYLEVCLIFYKECLARYAIAVAETALNNLIKQPAEAICEKSWGFLLAAKQTTIDLT